MNTINGTSSQPKTVRKTNHRRLNSDPTTGSVLRPKQRHLITKNNSIRKIASVPYEDENTLISKRLNDTIEKHGKKHADVARLYNCVGNAYFKKNDFAKANEAYGEACCVYTDIWGSDHPYVAVSLGNLGTAHWKMGDYKRSAEYMEESVRILRKRSGGSDDDVMVTEALHNLGTVKVLMKDFEGARNALDRSLRGRIKILGKYHVDVARTRDSLGLVYMMTGDTARSKSHHKKALLAKDNTLGPTHPSTLMSLMNLARVHRQEHDFTTAIDMYKEAFAAQEKELFDDAIIIESGVTLHIIGDIQVENQSFFGALRSFRQASDIFKDAGLKDDDKKVLAIQKSVNRANQLLKETDLFVVRETSGAGDSYDS